jgi:hypothetical protein
MHNSIPARLKLFRLLLQSYTEGCVRNIWSLHLLRKRTSANPVIREYALQTRCDLKSEVVAYHGVTHGGYSGIGVATAVILNPMEQS